MAKVSGSYREQQTSVAKAEYGYQTIFKDSQERTRLTVGTDQAKDFTNLLDSWSKCTACPLSATRANVTFVSGRIPADVLFLLEAPGSADDQGGFPGSGPSGQFLSSLVQELRKSRTGWEYAVASPIGCVPWNRPEDGQEPIGYRQPEASELTKCNPRFLDLLRIVNPAGIVLFGSLAEKYWSDYGAKVQTALDKRFKIVTTQSLLRIIQQGGAKESNVQYRNTLSGLKQFLFQTLNVGKE